MACPWAKINNPEPVNFQDVISEELARDLQRKEEEKMYALSTDNRWSLYEKERSRDIKNKDVQKDTVIGAHSAEFQRELDPQGDVTETCQSDEMIAKMLQMQFDKEHDDQLKRREHKFNGTSKVCVSFDNYRRAPQNFDFESDSEEEEIEDIRDRKDWDRFDTLQREMDSIPPCGYKVQNGNVITKHDVIINGRKNACKLLSFPPEFHTGDGENFDLKLSNKVFNSLKRYSQNEQSRRHKVRDKKEDQATAEFGLDEYTCLLLYKMINNEILERVSGVISIGKEAVILNSEGNRDYQKFTVPKNCVLKVFKTTLSEFKQRDKYIKDDHRFKDRIGKQTSRKTVHLWAEKEMANLYRLQRAGIPCPKVITLKKHVLVMSLIGIEDIPAPKLKDAVMNLADYVIAYEQVVQNMKRLFDEANLIHADLSEYNILWHHNQCHFIDVSQSVEPIHVNAFHFLMRDCNNITTFFRRKNVPEILSAEELFETITGCRYDDQVKLLSLQESFKPKPHLVDRVGIEITDKFEKVWEEIRREPSVKVDFIKEETFVESTEA